MLYQLSYCAAASVGIWQELVLAEQICRPTWWCPSPISLSVRESKTRKQVQLFFLKFCFPSFSIDVIWSFVHIQKYFLPNLWKWYWMDFLMVANQVGVLKGHQYAGSNCNTAVEHTLLSKTLEVMGLNPARCWAFFFSSLSFQLWVLYSSPPQRCNTTDFPIKICLAVQLEANHT